MKPMFRDDRRDRNPKPMNTSAHPIPDWTEDSTQVDREFAEVCEMRDYYHLLHHSSDCLSHLQH
jgi:hypothetical protein